MMMARAGIIQPFPPGMVYAPPPADELPARATRPVPSIAERRRQLIDELARLKTHSHRRAQLMGRLRELTRAELQEGLK